MSENTKDTINATKVEGLADTHEEQKVNTGTAPPVDVTVKPTGQHMPTEEGQKKVELYLDDPEIKALRAHCPLPEENLAWLKADIEEHGCLDSIKYFVWEGRNILLDGYNRFEICESANPKIPYSIQQMEFYSHEEAINYFIDAQMARRNLTEIQKAYFNGHRYNIVKKPHGGDRRSPAWISSGHSGHLKTKAEKAEEAEISARSLRRYAKVAKGIDNLSEVKGSEFAREVLDETVKISQKQLEKFGGMTPEEVKEELEKEKPDKSNDEKFADFDKILQSGWKKLKEIDKITITEASKTKLKEAIDTASAISNMLKKIPVN